MTIHSTLITSQITYNQWARIIAMATLLRRHGNKPPIPIISDHPIKRDYHLPNGANLSGVELYGWVVLIVAMGTWNGCQSKLHWQQFAVTPRVASWLRGLFLLRGFFSRYFAMTYKVMTWEISTLWIKIQNFTVFYLLKGKNFY